MIYVVADIQLEEGKQDEFLHHIAKLVPLVLAEEGCVEYGPAIDLKTTIAAQSPVQIDHVTVMEKWADLESLEKHLAAPHMVAFRETVGGLIKELKLRVFQPYVV